MELNSVNQIYLFFLFILIGLLIGFTFDIFRLLRKKIKAPDYITYIEDILFWIITTLIILYSLFLFNNGQIRGYIFVGIIAGILIYILLFSRIIINVFSKIIDYLLKIFSLLLSPVVLIFRYINLIRKKFLLK